jgi:hypothetical protein
MPTVAVPPAGVFWREKSSFGTGAQNMRPPSGGSFLQQALGPVFRLPHLCLFVSRRVRQRWATLGNSLAGVAKMGWRGLADCGF